MEYTPLNRLIAERFEIEQRILDSRKEGIEGNAVEDEGDEFEGDETQ